ncbi:MAG: hypothetical protein JSV30_02705 [Candidatus Omnitrophota bacterium]|nr:MAG: hypothetical protein JSV30_02705 [Candidatus Omnitrophota bacterium]
MEEGRAKEEKIPIEPPLQVVDYRTLSKAFGWWAAAVLIESWGRKQVCLYLWQRKKDGWKRKQKFTVHDAEKWEQIVQAVEELLPKMQG